jgi:hypothetical protein
VRVGAARKGRNVSIERHAFALSTSHWFFAGAHDYRLRTADTFRLERQEPQSSFRLERQEPQSSFRLERQEPQSSSVYLRLALLAVTSCLLLLLRVVTVLLISPALKFLYLPLDYHYPGPPCPVGS